MIRNYFKLALKILLRRKFFTFVSLFGTGFTLLVLLLVAAILDSAMAPGVPETKLDRTLHVGNVRMAGPRNESSSSAGFLLLDQYLRDIEGVETFAICSGAEPAAAFKDGKKFELQVRHTDAAFWEAFTFDFLAGRPFSDAEDKSAAMVAVINESTKRRFFGEKEAVGERIEAGGQRYEVIGVVSDVAIVRVNTSAEIWAPIGTIPSPEFRRRLLGGFTGVLVVVDRAAMNGVREEVASRVSHVQLLQPDRYDTIEAPASTQIELVARDTVGERYGKARVGRFFAFVLGGAILFMALPAINLINVNLSRMLERASEIGVRKAFGATSTQLVGQFVFENVILSVLGGLLGLLGGFFVILAVNRSGVIPYADLAINYRVFLYAMAASIFFGVLSGAYPAWRMSRLDAVAALKGAIR